MKNRQRRIKIKGFKDTLSGGIHEKLVKLGGRRGRGLERLEEGAHIFHCDKRAS